MRILTLSLTVIISIACSGAPAQPPSQSTPAAPPAASAEEPGKDEATARAAALVEDLKRREEAQEKLDRENPALVAPPIVLPVPPSPAPQKAPVAATPPSGAEARPSAPPPAAVAPTPGRNEAWWKQERRRLQEILDMAQVQLAEAEKLNFKYGYNDAQAEYQKRASAVAAARSAIDQLHEDARRAGSPRHGSDRVRISSRLAVYSGVTTRGGDVVVLVMPGVSLVYVARVIQDGEGLDTIKDRFITSIRPKAFTEARAMAQTTGGRVLQWMMGANEPNPWPEA